jgi:hypothetical protein
MEEPRCINCEYHSCTNDNQLIRHRCRRKEYTLEQFEYIRTSPE